MPTAVDIASTAATAPVTSSLMPLSRKKWVSIFGTFITVAGLAQGCGGPSVRSAAGSSVEKTSAPGAKAGDGGRRAGALRVLIDGEPQALGPDGDLWGARIARLLGDPVLACGSGEAQAATLDAEAPNRLSLRPRDGVSPSDLVRALETARLADVTRVETLGGLVRLSVRRSNVRLK